MYSFSQLEAVASQAALNIASDQDSVRTDNWSYLERTLKIELDLPASVVQWDAVYPRWLGQQVLLAENLLLPSKCHLEWSPCSPLLNTPVHICSHIRTGLK